MNTEKKEIIFDVVPWHVRWDVRARRWGEFVERKTFPQCHVRDELQLAVRTQIVTGIIFAILFAFWVCVVVVPGAFDYVREHYQPVFFLWAVAAVFGGAPLYSLLNESRKAKLALRARLLEPTD